MRGEYFFDKKGISPVIGTMLLILIVIVMASMFSIWAFKFVSDTQERALIDKMCNDVDFVSGNFCYNNLSIENLETGEIDKRINIEFDGRGVNTNSLIYGFLMLINYGGKVISISTLDGSEMEPNIPKSITSDFIKDSEMINSIILLPKVEINSKIFVCENKEKTIPWESMQIC